jgi:hypothetical protein
MSRWLHFYRAHNALLRQEFGTPKGRGGYIPTIAAAWRQLNEHEREMWVEDATVCPPVELLPVVGRGHSGWHHFVKYVCNNLAQFKTDYPGATHLAIAGQLWKSLTPDEKQYWSLHQTPPSGRSLP